jgi:DNA-binding response OmpR family regulator
MPIVDGLSSTKMIRAYERSKDNKGHSKLAAGNGRIPIFAVSASLVESSRQTYIDAGFDGWILKPVDFKRLNTLLMGIFEDDTRNSCLYVSGEWERGGWLCSRTDETGSQQTTPRAEEEKSEMVTDAEATTQEEAADMAVKESRTATDGP